MRIAIKLGAMLCLATSETRVRSVPNLISGNLDCVEVLGSFKREATAPQSSYLEAGIYCESLRRKGCSSASMKGYYDSYRVYGLPAFTTVEILSIFPQKGGAK